MNSHKAALSRESEKLHECLNGERKSHHSEETDIHQKRARNNIEEYNTELTKTKKIMEFIAAEKVLDISSPEEKAAIEDLLMTWHSLSNQTRRKLKFLLTNYSNESSLEEGNPLKPLNGYSVRAIPVERAMENVFVFRNNEGAALGWRNVYHLPIQYDVELFPRGVLNLESSALAARHMPSGIKKRRFLVVDEKVNEIYGAKITSYFKHYGIEYRILAIPGEEINKRMEAVDKIIEELCSFGLLRREPIVAIGGGCVLDIVGLAANLYRRGVPYIRVPTTLLSIVDASVGVKNGVDYVSCSCGPQKNRVGSFYAPAAAFLDKTFISSQNERNIVNGLGEIMKLALVRSTELFCLLEAHGPRLIKERFQGSGPVADRVIELSIQIMLEELGPNLWEKKLERCVDYGHTFSKIIEMVPEVDLMHGEAVNIDGFICVLISKRRGMISQAVCDRIFQVMKSLKLPTFHDCITMPVLNKALSDAVEHRNGAQRIPLITGIGASICVNDIKVDELAVVCEELRMLH